MWKKIIAVIDATFAVAKRNPVPAWIFFRLSFRSCKSCVYKCDDLLSWTTENKSSKWPERDSNPGPQDCESDALTTLPRCLIVSNRKTVEGTVKKNENETYRLLGHNAFIFFLPCSILWSRADNKKNKLLKQLSEATTNCKPRDCKGQLQTSLIFNCVNARNLLRKDSFYRIVRL